MNCFNDGVIASAICSGCGKALCKDCVVEQASGILTCGDRCTARAELEAQALQRIHSQGRNQALAGAYGSYITAGVFILLAFFVDSSGTAVILGGAGISLAFMGGLFHRGAAAATGMR